MKFVLRALKKRLLQDKTVILAMFIVQCSHKSLLTKGFAFFTIQCQVFLARIIYAINPRPQQSCSHDPNLIE